MKKEQAVSNKLILKLVASLFLLIVLMGVTYITLTVYLSYRYFEETSQKLNSNLAQHLIEEKFQHESPFLENGEVNKPLFGDIMHDMMAVNRGIEVYLLDTSGKILFSVVLQHDGPDNSATYVNLEPVTKFIEHKGDEFVLGDDPLNPERLKVFSAAKFNIKNHEGYIYIVLESQVLENVTTSLFSSYFMKLGLEASIITMLFVMSLGFLIIWVLTKNLRSIIKTVKRFREGDYSIRMENSKNSDLSVLETTFNDMADTIVENMEEIKSVDNLRRELIANVSHDLRTPLSIMKGYVETLQIKKEALTEAEKSDYLDIIQNGSDKLSKLVDQLFEYSKLEAKQVKPVKEPFSIIDLVLDLIASNKIIAEKNKIELVLNASKKLPLVFADISLVERAIQNLLDNALKFTPENGIITLKLTPQKSTVEITVSDTGSGIKESETLYVFERYRQTEQHNSQEGVGLGLAIVKKIMELHDTTIQVTSKPNQGSSFQFYLQCYQANLSAG